MAERGKLISGLRIVNLNRIRRHHGGMSHESAPAGCGVSFDFATIHLHLEGCEREASACEREASAVFTGKKLLQFFG